MKCNKYPVFKRIKQLVIFYIVFAAVGSTVPYMVKKEVSSEMKHNLNEKIGQRGNEGTDKALLIEDNTEALALRISMLREAEEKVDIVYHVMHYDESTLAFLNEVYEAAGRGVEVRMLIDGKTGTFNYQMNNVFNFLNKHDNIEIRKYNKIHVLKPWKWHALLHDKFIIADDKYLLLGGRNIGNRYYEPQGYKEDNVVYDRDVFIVNHLDYENSVMKEVSDYMELLFNHEDTSPRWIFQSAANNTEQMLKETCILFEENNEEFFRYSMAYFEGNALETENIYLIHNPINTGKKEPWVGYALKEIILGAEEQILIQTPYSTANKNILEFLEESSSERDTVLLTNSIGSSPNYPAFSNYYTARDKYIETGVHIFEYQGAGSIHGKTVIIDNKISIVGSLNMDDRSLYIDTETMLVIEGEAFTESLWEVALNIKSSSLEVGSDNQYIENESIAEIIPDTGKKLTMRAVSIFSRIFGFLI